MIRSVRQPNIFQITGLVANGNRPGKLSFPVDPSVLLYSRYKHVRGAASIGPGNGAPLTKLRALDNLIDRLIRLRGNQPIVRNIDDLNAGEIEGLLASYRKGLHRALAAGNAHGNTGLEIRVSVDLVA